MRAFSRRDGDRPAGTVPYLDVTATALRVRSRIST
ncbi:hypothetical protein STVIR_0435 [Streptomyces viridochromogenes Tue57]|uniref:Uncharacterized protein n=1 Tax=Streptomyces viridochromogenes Tue57 TaxID=1160705 RepID=L8PTJ4_STRVR|nr:hypothetical protein STVIR_0435 [Streptomyces viridochromogenes Tue57]